MSEYKYKGLPITPSITESLTIELTNGQIVKRDDLVKRILEHHISNGGMRPEAQDFSRSVKKALEKLQQKGHASNKSYGFWAIHKNDAPVQIEEATSEIIKAEDLPTHAIYGQGEFAVYCYYFPTYKMLAEAQGKNRWPCKIGRTDRDPLLRILSQSSTALPETPFIEFVVKTQNSNLLETAIHSILQIRGQHLINSPGTEWFETNPDEVLGIIKYLKEEMLNSDAHNSSFAIGWQTKEQSATNH